jgi:stage III sporulation protein AD
MSSLIKICGGAIIAAVCAFTLKEGARETSVGAALIGLSVILGTVLSEFLSVISPLKEAMSESGASTYADIMLKGLGVAITVKVTTDVCTDLGEKGLSDCVELAGKAEILLLCMPILTKMLDSVKELLL